MVLRFNRKTSRLHPMSSLPPKQHIPHAFDPASPLLHRQMTRANASGSTHRSSLHPPRHHGCSPKHTYATSQQNQEAPSPDTETAKTANWERTGFLTLLLGISASDFAIDFLFYAAVARKESLDKKSISTILAGLACFDAKLEDKNTSPREIVELLEQRASNIQQLGQYDQGLVREVVAEVGYQGIKQARDGRWIETTEDFVDNSKADARAGTAT